MRTLPKPVKLDVDKESSLSLVSPTKKQLISLNKTSPRGQNNNSDRKTKKNKNGKQTNRPAVKNMREIPAHRRRTEIIQLFNEQTPNNNKKKNER